jgi:hypothetical protein
MAADVSWLPATTPYSISRHPREEGTKTILGIIKCQACRQLSAGGSLWEDLEEMIAKLIDILPKQRQWGYRCRWRIGINVGDVRDVRKSGFQARFLAFVLCTASLD